MSYFLGRSPLPPAPRPEPPVYGTPTAPTRFIHLAPSRPEFYSPAIRNALRDIEFITSWRHNPHTHRWPCDISSFHICWSGRLQCPLCVDTFPAVCDGVRWRVPEHGCRTLAPFLDEARRQQR